MMFGSTFLFWSVACWTYLTTFTSALESVDSLLLEDFTGLWYEVYTDDGVGSTFEKDDYCVTEYYRERDNGFLSLHRRNQNGAPNGTTVIRNAALMPDREKVGQFYFRSRDSPVVYSYWVLALGPLDSNGLYSYAITSDETGALMWVLARNVTEFFIKYDAEVLVQLEEFGFKNGTKQPVISYQGSDCVYEDTTSVEPVPELAVNKYMGLWYEMYTDNMVSNSWENDTFCQQKNYGLRDGGERIGVHNYHTIGAPDGDTSTMTGYMLHNDNLPGEFLLHFPELTERAMHVWVLALGPLDSAGLYSYAITSDPTGTVMWVLARNVTEFNLLYDAQVLTKLDELGFNEGAKAPVASYQGSDCEYENAEPVDTVDNLDLSKYLGTYYEMYTDSFVASAWERETYCSTITYSDLEDGSGAIGFRNIENLGAPNGTAQIIEGLMKAPPGASSSQFMLRLPDLMSRAVPYWVLDLGPLDADGQYAYVMMGGSTGLTMWVLARDVDDFNLLYDEEVQAKMEAMGYKYGDRVPVAMYQGGDCDYTDTSLLDQEDDDSLSTGGLIGLHVIIAIALGMFIVAGVLFCKNRPGRKSSNPGDMDEESMHLVTDINSFTTNPLAKNTPSSTPGSGVDKSALMREESGGDESL